MTDYLIGMAVGLFALWLPLTALAKNPTAYTRVPWVKPRKPRHSNKPFRSTFTINPTPRDD